MALKNGTGTVNGYDIGPQVDLTGALLSGANLSGADLTDATFFGAFMIHSNFSDADLSGASLSCGDFEGAKFTGADLTDSDLTGANFTDATVDSHHVELIESAHRRMMQSLTVNGARKGGRAKNPGIATSLDEILRSTRPVFMRVESSRSKDGHEMDVDVKSSIYKFIDAYARITGKRPTEAVVNRALHYYCMEVEY